MPKNKKIIFLFAIIGMMILMPVFVFAKTTESGDIYIKNQLAVDIFKINTAQAQSKSVDLAQYNPLKWACPSGKCDANLLIGSVIKAFLGIVGSIALLMFIYGGFMMLTSHGNEQKVSKAKDVLVWATIGLAIIFLSYTILNFVISALTGKSSTTSNTATQGIAYVPENNILFKVQNLNVIQ